MRLSIALLLLLSSKLLPAAYPAQTEGDWISKDFKFKTGEVLPEFRLHYITLGTPKRNAQGVVNNAVLIMHGTGGTGRAFLSDHFAGVLFGPGQLLDASKYFIILPDAVGHGKSSKPSDGMHMRFPKYTYEDMIHADYRMITEKLHVNHLRLVMGTSMGAMNTWDWGWMYPHFIDALMPLASNAVEIAGRNWMLRQMMINAIEMDPEWKGGEYTQPPVYGLTCAEYILSVMTSSPLQMQKTMPTHAQVVKAVDALGGRATHKDANDSIYQYQASRLYNPDPHLGEIKAPLLAINSADDQVNPPELGIAEREIKKVAHGRFVLLPITDQTRGHGTHSLPAIWDHYLAELLAESAK
jgi:homoserine O-acetyltransferase